MKLSQKGLDQSDPDLSRISASPSFEEDVTTGEDSQ